MIFCCILKSLKLYDTYYLKVDADSSEAAEEFCKFTCPDTYVKYIFEDKSILLRKIKPLDDTELIELIADKNLKYHNKTINHIPYLYVENKDTEERTVYELTP